MTERFERMITFGASPVNYNLPETWTDETKQLYERLKGGDWAALAPLLDIDLEFITDSQAMRALVMLKWVPGVPDKEARRELGKIANIIRRRPGNRGAKLPYGDWLNEFIRRMASWIRESNLLPVKDDPNALAARIRETRPDLGDETQKKLCAALIEAARFDRGSVRSPKSWALKTFAVTYRTEPKAIEKRISRDLKSGRRKR